VLTSAAPPDCENDAERPTKRCIVLDGTVPQQRCHDEDYSMKSYLMTSAAHRRGRPAGGDRLPGSFSPRSWRAHYGVALATRLAAAGQPLPTRCPVLPKTLGSPSTCPRSVSGREKHAVPTAHSQRRRVSYSSGIACGPCLTASAPSCHDRTDRMKVRPVLSG
jgi:hypothetical protein